MNLNIRNLPDDIPEEWKRTGHADLKEFMAWLKGQTKPKRRNQPKSGTPDDLGFFVRSGWERNWARYLKWLQARGEIVSFKYEPRRYPFNEWYVLGAMHYTPDFLVTYPNGHAEYHEVKGRLLSEDKTRLKRYRKHYGDIPIVMVGKASKLREELKNDFHYLDYPTIEKQAKGLIPHWGE